MTVVDFCRPAARAALAAALLIPSPELEAQDMERMREAMEAATRLGEEHEVLGGLVGAWDVEIRVLMAAGPDAGPQVSRGRADIEWLVEGRWLGHRLTGEMFGAEYESFSIRGWDGYAKNWVTATVSSLDNALNVTRGVRSDPEGRVLVEYGTLDEYTTGELNKAYRTVTRLLGPDRHVVEVWDMAVGEDGMKVIEMAYTRR